MAVYQEGVDVSFVAAADLSNDQFHLVVLDASGEVVGASVTSVPMLGILQNKPAAANRAATVRVSGISKCVASDAINENDYITSDGAGFANATTTDTQETVGIAVTATAGSAEVFSVLVRPQRFAG